MPSSAGKKKYIAMELVRGQSLRAWQAAARRTSSVLCEAYLAALHSFPTRRSSDLLNEEWDAQFEPSPHRERIKAHMRQWYESRGRTTAWFVDREIGRAHV